MEHRMVTFSSETIRMLSVLAEVHHTGWKQEVHRLVLRGLHNELTPDVVSECQLALAARVDVFLRPE